MNLSAPFIRRPIGTTLLTVGLMLLGVAAYFRLPVAALPQVDFPTVSVSANLPGAGPQIMASSVATPLERRLGHIADVSEMTSQSTTGQTNITVQFGLDRDINGAARDVQAAINAARVDLPASLRSNPTYRKVNPADAPVLILAMTSATRTPGQIYDAAATVVQQRLSQVHGVGDVSIGGGSLPAVRVDVNPLALASYGLGSEDVRAALASANANRPIGLIEDDARRWQIYTSDQAQTAADFRPLVIAYRNGAPVRLSDVATVTDGVEDVHNLGLFNGRPAILVIISRQPGANVVATVDAVRQALPQLGAALPQDVSLAVAADRTVTTRASLADVERTLMLSILLVVLVVFVFLRSGRATLIPAVAVAASLLGALAAMYALGFGLDNLSLMALTIATGFVVDDAIVVSENVARHVEAGEPPGRAALLGAREVGFTVLSISVSLIAVFIPILFMGGIVGRLFREFALTLSAAILVSLIVSLTTTPMMCALLMKRRPAPEREGRWARRAGRAVAALQARYRRALVWALDNAPVVLAGLIATVALNVYLITIVPKGFFPQQDTGTLVGSMQADQSSSFQLSQQRMRRFVDVIRADQAVQTVVGYVSGAQSSSGFVFVTLKPKAQRQNLQAVTGRLRRELGRVGGANLYLQPVQDVRMGGRSAAAAYQYTLKAADQAALRTWGPRLTEALRARPELADVNTDQQDAGLSAYVTVDRDTAARFGVNAALVDETLYDAFGQRQVSTIYKDLNQYHVVLGADSRFTQHPASLADIHVSVGAPAAVGPTAPPSRDPSPGVALSATPVSTAPLRAFATWAETAAPTLVRHQDLAPAVTISFNLATGQSLSDATRAVAAAETAIGLPASVRGGFQGTAKAYQESLAGEPMLILAAVLAVYIVLGILYESLVHPITVLSTLPSAGVGAVLALILFRSEFSVIALIGVLLLIGIVKKNAILIIDFALEAERSLGLSAREAVYRASLLRFRPILMTTFAAALGALPLAIGWGEGAELRRPLGLTIVGGLLVSQVLTLLTTPVVYLYLDRFRRRAPGEARLSRGGGATPSPDPAL